MNLATAAQTTRIAATAALPPSVVHATEAEGLYNPIADPRAIVEFGNARFTVLTPHLIRMEWSTNGKFEDRASLVFLNRRLPVPKFDKSSTDGQNTLTIVTDALKLTYTPMPDGKPLPPGSPGFTPETLEVSVTVGHEQVTWHPGQADPDNLLGTAHSLDGAKGTQLRDPLEPGLVSRSGWALIDDTTRPLFDSTDFTFRDGEKSPWPWGIERPADQKPGSYIDWYFFGYGHDYRQALGDYVRVAGRIPLPPRYAFGAWWSRWWDYSDQEINDLVRGFRESDVPLDVIDLDTAWHLSEAQLKPLGEVDQSKQADQLGWTGYTWNPYFFPDPDQFVKRLHEDGVKLTLILHTAAGIEPWEKSYPEMARAMGVDPATRKYIPFNPTDKKFAVNYFDLMLHPLEKQGVDFFWMDWWWQAWQPDQLTSLPNVKPTWWLNYIHFTDQQREGKRPLILHRWGGLGNHRYQVAFSGDTNSSWEQLGFQFWFTATAANVGFAYWSHDIGGHLPGVIDPELLTRWVQFGAFSPILRTHFTRNPDAERRPWAQPEPYSDILRSAYQLRYALEPYTYTEARKTFDTGIAFFRPLYYDWPDADAAYSSKGEYVFGDQMLVAPVATASDKITGLSAENVWLPKGEWIEWPTGKHFAVADQAGSSFSRNFSLDQVPVYLRAGAIVPMQPPMRYTGEKPVDPLIVNVWPLQPGSSSTYSVYEDSGVAVEYQRGAFTRTPVKATQSGDSLRVEIGPVQGSFPGMLLARGYELRLPADWPPATVTVNGAVVKRAASPGERGWSFVGNTLTTIIPVPSQNVAAKITIEVRRAAGLTARRGELDGFAGRMTRLRAAYDALQQTAPVSASPDLLVDAMQSGNRLGYHPERAVEEIEHFHQVLPKAQGAVSALDESFSKSLANMIERNSATTSAAELEAQKQRRLDLLYRAQKLVVEAEN
jgi:alpha-glucosidase (family GH31 glycosyl hydrolase)